MRMLTSTLLALSVLAGVSGRVLAQTANEIDPNDSKEFYQQLDRENRGGQGQ
jgi:hypothetical protein